MTNFKYQYSLDDFPDGGWYIPNLVNEIQSSDIITALDHIDGTIDSIKIYFKSELSSIDKTILDGDTSSPAGGLIALHNNTVPQEVENVIIIEQPPIVIDGPTADDGKNIFTINPFPDGKYVYYAGISDNIVTGERGVGNKNNISCTGIGEFISEAQFVDTVWIYGGEATTYGYMTTQDYADASLVAAATNVIFASGQDGNCNLYPVISGYLNIIVPATGNGYYNVDITSGLNSNLENRTIGTPTKVTAAVPVPTENNTGYWNMDINTGEITPNYIGSGVYNLYDQEITLAYWMRNYHLWCPPPPGYANHHFDVPCKATRMLPHWKVKVKMKTYGSGICEMFWQWWMARDYSV